MSVESRLVHDPAEWNDLVERAAGATPFHRHEALQVLADHSGTTPYHFVGYKGQEPVGLFPVFALELWPLRAAFSPPPDLEVSYLGPVVFDGNGAKQRTAERRHRRFVESTLEAIDDEIDPHYSHVRAGTDYDDPRPFLWNGFEPTPRYTYAVDLQRDREELFMSFSSDVRRNVRTAEDEFDAEIREGDAADVERIVRGVRERHAEQGVSYAVTPAFARDLHRIMPDDAVRAYVCEVGDEFVGGKLTLEDGGTIYGWQTVADLDHDLPATDLLDWTVMKRARERGLDRMDLVGANTQRLCGYKAKFNPEVSTYYSLESSTVATDAVKALYKRVRDDPATTGMIQRLRG